MCVQDCLLVRVLLIKLVVKVTYRAEHADGGGGEEILCFPFFIYYKYFVRHLTFGSNFDIAFEECLTGNQEASD